MALTGYEIVQDELYTESGYAAKAVQAPVGKKVVSGGFRFAYDNTDEYRGVTVVELGPWGGIYGDGTR